MNTKTVSNTRIVIVEGDGILLSRMLEALAAESFNVRVVPVHPGHDYKDIVRSVEVCAPDIILVADILSDSLRGHVLLDALRGDFHAKVASPGNPHVISTSRHIPPELTALIGGMFEAKMDLISAKLEEREGAAQHLVDVVKECIRRLNH